MLQLLELSRGHGHHQRLHGGHLRLHLLHEIVERSRRRVAEHVGVLVHEGVEIGLLARNLLHERVVQLARHVLHALEIALGQLPHHPFNVPEERLRHGTA